MSEVLSKFSCDHIPEGDSCGLVVTLVEQNAELRKLVADMHALATDHDVYVRYSYSHAWDEKLAVVEKQMRELGVDV